MHRKVKGKTALSCITSLERCSGGKKVIGPWNVFLPIGPLKNMALELEGLE